MPLDRRAMAALSYRIMPNPEFLSKVLAAEYLGLSVRRLMEISEDGKQLKRYPQMDPVLHREVTMFRRADIERLKREWTPLTPRLALPAPELPEVEEPPDPAVPTVAWLTLRQAAAYTGLPVADLREAVLTGELHARDVGVREGGRYRVKRSDLDAIEGGDLS